MPTSPIMQLPRSQSPEEFEAICADILAEIHKIPFEKYGRRGQKQNGIDLVDSSNRQMHIVAQCKNYHSCKYEEFQRRAIKDIKSAQKLPFHIETFYVMTSLNPDISSQNILRNASANFNIETLFWDKIQKIICDNPILLNKYYPYLCARNTIPLPYKNELISNTITLLELAGMLGTCDENYRVSIDYDDDVYMYNKCVQMVLAATKLKELQQQWFLQLDEHQIVLFIDKVIEGIPTFYREETDMTGANMIYTITNFLSYFRDNSKRETFKGYCNEIIYKIKCCE